MSDLRGWVVGVLGAAIVAAAVLAATEQQRTTAETNFKEADAASRMQIAMLSQERGLDGFLASGRPQFLEVVYRAQLQLTENLAAARLLARDDVLEVGAVKRQATTFRRWRSLATAAIARRQSTNADDLVAHERQRNAEIDAFLLANNAYQARLLVNRYHEGQSSALLPVWVLLGLGALLTGVGLVVRRRKRAAQRRVAAFATTQAQFVEAIQFTESEPEAHELLTHHLESTIPGSSVIVLNRNNSIDRLEPAQPLPAGHPLAEQLLVSQPRSCLAVRLSRRYDRGRDDAAEVFGCMICGALTGPSSCQPLLVGGEVIGSVLVGHDDRLSSEADGRLQDTVSQAAPVLANLRNLALAESRAATDALTGLPNRRSVDDTLRRMLAQADRSDRPFSIVLLDLDHFKQINDTCGHDRGDDVLAALAALLRSELRASDFAGRNGGEEFVLFLPDTDRPGAFNLAEKTRRSMHKLRVAGVERAITGSFGIAAFPDDATTAEGLMRIADRALYAAKQQGRDRVASSQPSPMPVVELATATTPA
jgi:diguanylate cyclase (GGDEF)-like protein